MKKLNAKIILVLSVLMILFQLVVDDEIAGVVPIILWSVGLISILIWAVNLFRFITSVKRTKPELYKNLYNVLALFNTAIFSDFEKKYIKRYTNSEELTNMLEQLNDYEISIIEATKKIRYLIFHIFLLFAFSALTLVLKKLMM